MKTSIAGFLLATLFPSAAFAADTSRHPEERDGKATIIHRADVIPDRATNNAARGGLWPLYSTAEVRMNYFEVTGRGPMHFHPDTEHRLYVLEGKVSVTVGTNTTVAMAGDFIVIPRGVRHCYDVPAKGDRALLLTFDAPPYDPRKTVNVESTAGNK
jgi:quercetin dioxygenase-like cupin family protein